MKETNKTLAATTWTKDQMDFSVSGLAYDANENIRNLVQKGMVGPAIATIDQLTYAYQSNSNKLQGGTDAVNNPASTLGDFKEINGTGTNDYSYDSSGN
jgi:hypothetical protein